MSIDFHPDDSDNGRAYIAAWRDHRRRVLSVAYRMLGSLSDAEDVVQETYARFVRIDVASIDDTRGWLIAVATRLCLDELRSSRVRRRTYAGPWLPEPVLTTTEHADPVDAVTLDESIRIAVLVVLEQLTPAERAVFVLHDVFQFSFEEIAAIVNRTPAACRQLASRARRHIAAQDDETRFSASREEQQQLADSFAAACRTGTLDALIAVLDPSCSGEFDSGGMIVGAPLTGVVGAERIARTLVAAFAGAGATFDVVDVNGEPGVIVRSDGRVATIIAVTAVRGRVGHIRAIGNPEKLRHVGRPIPQMD